MPEVFADTFFWIALLNPADKWHQEAQSFSQTNPAISIITSDAVLIETLNYFAEAGERMRRAAAELCDQALVHPHTIVLPQTRQTFGSGLDFYKARSDKGYSLTDCISMIEMGEHKISDVLTPDRHFVQEGFVILFR